MDIGIVGYGYVGKGIANFLFKDKNSYFTIYDTSFISTEYHSLSPDKHYQIAYTNDINLLSRCDLIFICVPTPSNEDDSCNTSIVESVITEMQKLSNRNKNQIFVIKSTVVPGTCDKLSVKFNEAIVFNPEFSGEPKYLTGHKFLTDVCDSPFFIFGGCNKNTVNKVLSYFQQIGGPEKKYIATDYITAEMMKTVNNSFFALKVAFCNEVYDLCEKVGVNYNELRELWLLDPRNGRDFTSVFSENRGYGGKCLPKETKSLIALARQNQTPMLTLEGAHTSNESKRNKTS